MRRRNFFSRALTRWSIVAGEAGGKKGKIQRGWNYCDGAFELKHKYSEIAKKTDQTIWFLSFS